MSRLGGHEPAEDLPPPERHLGLETPTGHCQASKLPLYGLPSAIAARLIAGSQVRAAMPHHVGPVQDLGQQIVAVVQPQQRPRLHAAALGPPGKLGQPPV